MESVVIIHFVPYQYQFSGDGERNSACSQLIYKRAEQVDQRRLQHYSLLLFSILLPVEPGTDCYLYESQLSATTPRWRDIPSRVFDVGFCDRWITLDRGFVNWDITEETLALPDRKPSADDD